MSTLGATMGPKSQVHKFTNVGAFQLEPGWSPLNPRLNERLDEKFDRILCDKLACFCGGAVEGKAFEVRVARLGLLL